MKDVIYPSHINERGEIQSNQDHSIGTAILAQQYLAPIHLGAVGYFAGLLHDCGKFTPEFVEYLKKAVSGEKVHRGSIIHTFSGVSFLLRHYHNEEDPYAYTASEIIACAIGSHHGLFDCIDENGHSGFQHRLDKQPEYDNKAIGNFFAAFCNEETIEHYWKNALKELTPALDLCLELDKHKEECSESAFYFGLLTRVITSALIDADRTDTARFMVGNSSIDYSQKYNWDECLERIDKYLNWFPAQTKMQKVRRFLSEECERAAQKEPGIYRLDIPTGGGKTLSGLRFAVAHAAKFGKSRIVYVAPLLSIIDQNAEIIKNAIDDDAAVLEHHSNIIKEDFVEEELRRYELLAENWNSPVVITTMVQLLNTLFGGHTSQVRRFHALTDSVLILDEVQSVPNKLLSLFVLSLNFLCKVCNATIVLCSATQPPFDEVKLEHSLYMEPEKILSDHILQDHEDVFKRTVLQEGGRYRLKEIPDYVMRIVKQYNNVLVVCNKKAEAAALYEALQEQCRCFHLSASMCMAHRKRILTELYAAIENQVQFVCIATQVIEAGVDISFNAVVRFNAGLDSIVQAAGRCNRHGKGHDAPVYIIACADESLTGLDEIKAAQNATNDLLFAFKKDPERFGNDLSSDEAVLFYYRALYGSLAQGYSEYPVNGTTLYDMLSLNDAYCQIDDGNEQRFSMNQAFRSAGKLFEVIDSNQTTVIVQYGEGERFVDKLKKTQNFEEQKSLLQQLKPYSISLYDYQIRKLEEMGGIHYCLDGNVAILDKVYYSEEIGFNIKKGGNTNCSILIL